MQDFPLTLTHILRHGARVHRRSQVLTYTGDAVRSATFAEVAQRAAQLAGALAGLGVGPDDRVGTFMWNTQEHLEAYFAVPCQGAVLHTLNLRLPANQLVHIVNAAADKVIFIHASVVPLLAKVAEQFTTVERYVVVDDTGAAAEAAGALAPFAEVCQYESLLGGPPVTEWPDLDERQAGSMNFTSGTTGDPKGVVYSHRSMFLHAMGVSNAGVLPMTDRDRVLVVVPMFHVNAWGLPYAAWMAGADIVMPARFLQGGPLTAVIEATRPTFSSGVPSIWNDMLGYLESHPEADISSLHTLTAGGSAVPAHLIEAYGRRGIQILQGWGMTETSPVCTIAQPPRGAALDDLGWRSKAGRVIPGVELRIITAEGAEAAWDGETVGEIEVRGPWITGSYFGEPTPEKFHDGWLRTGDVGHLDDYGFVTITDRVKDVIKSGGEWISSVDLENTLMGHPEVHEASVVGVPDERWGERPLAVIVRRPGSQLSAEELSVWVAERVARWWIPERWSFIDEVPKTSVGKFDKKLIRQRYAQEELKVDVTAR